MADTVGAAQLEINVDASGVEAGVTKAKKSIGTLGQAAKGAAKEASAGLDGIGTGASGAAGKVDVSTRNMINSIQRQIAAMEAGSRSGAEYYRVLAQQRGVSVDALKPYLDQLDAVTAKQAVAATAMGKGAIEFNKYGLSAKQTAAAMRQVPAQLTDIFVSLQGGQAPLTVLLQQGGQLKDVFGGIAPAARALGGAVLGMVNPLTLAAAAVVGLGAAYYQGSKEADAYAKALILTNNAAGLTVGQLQQMAERMDNVSGTQSEAAAALAQFAGSIALSGQNIERFSAIAIKMEKATGQAVSETVKQFEELAKSPLEASVKLNEKTNFLTASLYKQIKALDEQGKSAQAAAVALNAFASDSESKMAKLQDQLGYVESAWKSAGNVAKEAWDFFLGIGRPDTQEDVTKRLRTQLANVMASPNINADNRAGQVVRERIAAIRQELSYYDEMERMSKRFNSSQAEASQKVQARIAFDKEADKYLSRQVQMEREIARAKELGLKAGASEVEMQKIISGIKEKYTDKTKKPRDTSRVDASAQANLDIADIKTRAEAVASIYASSERIIDAQRQAGLLTESEYYQAKRGFLELNANAQVAALEAENARLEQEKLNTKDTLDRDRKVLENKAKIANIQLGLSSSLILSEIQETAAIKAKAAALLSAQQAAESYYQTQVTQQNRDLAGMGQGASQRSLNSGLSQIEDRYAQQRLDIENQIAQQQIQIGRNLTSEERAQYDARLRIIDDYKAKALGSYTDYYTQQKQMQGDWSLGASEAYRNYLDSASNVYSATEALMSESFKGMEDALVTFVTTGKLSFTDLANSIVADITRIIIKQQIANALTAAMGMSGSGGVLGFIGSVAGALLGGGGATSAASSTYSLSTGSSGLGLKMPRAIGGPVTPGGMYQVNEKGPELLTVGQKTFLMMGGNESGMVTPTSGSSGESSRPLVVNVQMPQGATRQTGQQFGAQIARELTLASRRNG